MSKGSEFERDVCRQLTAWWTGDPAADVVFWRTAGSGARATTRRKKQKDTTSDHCGDLGALTDDAAVLTRFVTFELKRGYPAATLTELLDGRPTKKPRELVGFLTQAVESSRNAKTPHWAVIHRRDLHESVLYADWGLFVAVRPCQSDWPDGTPLVKFSITSELPFIGVCRLDTFLATTCAQSLRRLIR